MEPVGGWTIDTVLTHVVALLNAYDEKNNARFESMQQSTNQSLRSAEQAVLKAETAAERRFESVNEFRNTLSDQQRNLMPRSEVAVVAGALTDKIAGLEAALSAKVNALEKQFDALQAERRGIQGGWGYAVGIVGFVLAIGSLIIVGLKFLQQTP